MLAILVANVASAEDVVILGSPRNPAARTRIAGEVVDFTGTELQLRVTGGNVTRVPTERVLSLDTQYLPEHQAADAAFARGDFAPAVTQYRAAALAERRVWVRRMILAQMVRAYRNTGNAGPAGIAFLLLTESDPTTQYFDCIPLAWTGEQPAGIEAKALEWLESADRPEAQLLGASWLLAGPRRDTALARLRTLTSDADPRVAWLAQAQLWRDAITTASAEDVARWQAALEKIPEPLRAGPYFVVGQALAFRRDAQGAALAMLRLPVQYPQERDLAARALLGAGELLEALKDSGGAAALYREAAGKYPEHPAAAEARQRLEQLAAMP